MEVKKYIAILGVLLLAFCSKGNATSYYCSPSGSMADSGTSVTSPWGILQDVFTAGKTFIPGDTLFLLSGNHGFPVLTGVNSADVVIARYKNDNPVINRIDFAGASHWILQDVRVYTSALPPKEPILEHPVYPISDNTLVRIRNSSSYITLSGCFIYSIENSSSWTANDWNYKAWNGVLVEGSCMHTSIQACHIKNTNFALELSGSGYTTVANSLVENFCGDAIIPGNNNLIEYNTFRDNYKTNGNHCDLVQGFGISNLMFRGNKLIARTPAHSSLETDCQGIGFFDGTFTNCTLENNLVSVETYHGITIFYAHHCKIINNTLIDMTAGGLVPWINITGADNLVRNNISSSMNTIEGTADHNIVLFRSKYGNYFTDPDNQDYHLKAGSPAINTGTETEAPGTDLDKTVRPQYGAMDVGAYEYYDGPDTLPPTTPSLLTVKNIGPFGFTLTWTASTDNVSVSGYDVYLDGVLDTTVSTSQVILSDLEDSVTYTLKVIARDAANNSSLESDPMQVTTLSFVTGIRSDLSDNGQMLIYPNPAEGEEIIIHLDKWGSRFLTIEVSDNTGKILFRQREQASEGDIILRNTFKSGIYIVRINDGQSPVCQKLLVK